MNSVVGKNLKALRDANHFTQDKVSDYLNIRRSAYANYESGDREAPIAVLEAACNLYGCELQALMSEDNEALQDMLVCSFRADDISQHDMHEVANFKAIVMNYLKMKRLLEK